jgi:hypothetical protein
MSENVEPVRQLYCSVCRDPIPEKRLRRQAITCSKECSEIRHEMIASLRNATRCRHCGRRRKLRAVPAREQVSGAVVGTPNAAVPLC